MTKQKKSTAWRRRNWCQEIQSIYQIQREIYNNAREGDKEKVHTLQQLLLQLPAAKMLAVKRVTEDNRKKIMCQIRLSPEERHTLGEKLTLENTLFESPVVRKAKECLAFFLLEPQWEALFESHSFASRPGRKAADATWQIRHKLKYGGCWVYTTSLRNCFHKINQEKLLDKLVTFPLMKRVLQSWLESGLFSSGNPFLSGEVLPPFLANCALNGIQKRIWQGVYRETGNKKKADKVLYIRWGNDFVIISPEKEWLHCAIKELEKECATLSLEICSEKSQTVHTLMKESFNDKLVDPVNEKRDFPFLGFTFTQRIVSKYKSVKLGGNKGRINVHPVVLPSKRVISQHFKDVSEKMRKCTHSLQLIRQVNPILRAWRNYYKFSDSRTYGQLPTLWDSRLNIKCRHWIKRCAGKWGRNPLYWTTLGGDNWVFYGNDPESGKKVYLDKYAAVEYSLQGYNRIDPKRSPYDGDVTYWSLHSGVRLMGFSSPKREYLLQAQKGLCALCKNPFTPMDFPYIEIDHIKAPGEGGSERWRNSRLLHKECHLQRSSQWRSKE